MCCVQVHIGSEQMETEMEKKRKPAKSVILAQPRCRPNAVALKLVSLLHIFVMLLAIIWVNSVAPWLTNINTPRPKKVLLRYGDCLCIRLYDKLGRWCWKAWWARVGAASMAPRYRLEGDEIGGGLENMCGRRKEWRKDKADSVEEGEVCG